MEVDDIDQDLTILVEAYNSDPNNLSSLLVACRDKLPCTPISALMKVLADVSRTEQGRQAVIDGGLLDLLAGQEWELTGQLAVQVCRLGGNICFDCPQGRQEIVRLGVLDKLALVVRQVGSGLPSMMWVVLPTFLHNFCCDSPDNIGLVRTLTELCCQYILSLSGDMDTDVVESFINFLAGLMEHDGKVELLSQPEIVKATLHSLSISTDPTLLESILDLIQDECQLEVLANIYMNNNMISVLLDKLVANPHSPVEISCLDILALLSSHPSLMPHLLEPIHSTLITWLNSDLLPTPHHTATTALIFGNYATSDTNCSHLITTTTIPATLVTLLSSFSPPKVLHAVVGCLRNLAVCKNAREQLSGLFLPQACVELLLHLQDQSDHTVTPKLVSTLRLVTQSDSEYCSHLGQNINLINCLVKLGSISLIPGLTIEVARLTCSLVRYSKSDQSSVILTCLQAGVLPLILPLLNSPHPQLINEVLVCLTLATAQRPPHPILVEQIDPTFLSDRLVNTLDNVECPAEIKSNVLTLVSNLLKWNLTGITDMLQQSNLKSSISNFDSESELSKFIINEL